MDRREITRMALVVIMVVTSACAGSVDDPPSGADRASGSPEVLDFEAPLLGGGTIRGADLAGQDVAFWFWAPW